MPWPKNSLLSTDYNSIVAIEITLGKYKSRAGRNADEILTSSHSDSGHYKHCLLCI